MAVCVPTSGLCKSTFAYALAHTVGWFAKWEGCQDITLLMQESSVVHSNREQLVTRALEWDASHVLFVDDDMYWPPKAVLSLISRNLPIVAVNYPKRSFPIEFTAIDLAGNRMLTTHASTGLQEAQFCGFGVALIQAHVFKALPAPRFLPGYMMSRSEYTTEDAPFMIAAKAAGFPTMIDHDASKMDIAHIGQHTYAWNQESTVTPHHG